jgi:hypothetical protein
VGIGGDFSDTGPTNFAPGVWGIAGRDADGVVGVSNASANPGVLPLPNSGVSGSNAYNGPHKDIIEGHGVFGSCDLPLGAGVGGFNQSGAGVRGVGLTGVFGVTSKDYGTEGFGVRGAIDNDNPSSDACGVVGAAAVREVGPVVEYIGLAGRFEGPVEIDFSLTVFGDETVFGRKSAAVRHPDGSYR